MDISYVPFTVGIHIYRLKAYAPVWVRPLVFWNVTWSVCVFSYRSSGITCRSYLQESSSRTYPLHRVTCQKSDGLRYYNF